MGAEPGVWPRALNWEPKEWRPCGRQSNDPKDVHNLIPQNLRLGRRDSADVIKVKDLEMRDYSGGCNLITGVGQRGGPLLAVGREVC